MNVNELINDNNESNGLGEEITQNAADDEEIPTEGNIIQLISFLLEDVEYGVDISSVHQIMRVSDITRLPNTPDYIKGVINLRGNVIPVVDVKERFGFPKADITELSRIIVIETFSKLIGLTVDNVHQVVRIPENNVDPPAALIEGVSEDFIYGIGRLRDRLIVILNLEKIIIFEDEIEKIDEE